MNDALTPGSNPPTRPTPTIASAMYVVYGFLAALVFTEFLKVLSAFLFARPAVLTFALALLAAFYLFHMLFDTLAYLVLYDKNPAPVTDEHRKHAVRECILWLLCRFMEFFMLTWLYDFVNILGDAAKSGAPTLLSSLARLSLDISMVCFGWAVWFILVFFTVDGQGKGEINKDAADRREHHWRMVSDLIFGTLFVGLWYVFSRQLIVNQPLAFALIYSVVALNVVRVYFIQKRHYTRNVNLYRG